MWSRSTTGPVTGSESCRFTPRNVTGDPLSRTCGEPVSPADTATSRIPTRSTTTSSACVNVSVYSCGSSGVHSRALRTMRAVVHGRVSSYPRSRTSPDRSRLPSATTVPSGSRNVTRVGARGSSSDVAETVTRPAPPAAGPAVTV